MRKVLIAVLLLCLAFAVFADDATVLPEGVARLTFANTFVPGITESYDNKGETQDMDKTTLYNLGGAFELGINDTISAAIQWAPGVYLYEDVENMEKVSLDGLADAFIGAKAQILGPSGFIDNENFRFAMALGVKVPFNEYNLEEAVSDFLSGEEFVPYGQSQTESLGLGARFYFDYMITKDFYINLYNQTAYFLPNQKYKNDLTNAATWQGAYNAAYAGAYVGLGVPAGDAAAATAFANTNSGTGIIDDPYEKADYEYPLYYNFEFDVNYDLYLTQKTKIGFGLPLKYNMNGKVTVDGTEQDGTDSYSVAIDPSISFFTAESIPFEVVLDYYMTLAGKNTQKTNYVGFQLKLFYDFY